jgi:hypothetical protein
VPASRPGSEQSVEREAWNALAASDVETPTRLATEGNSWGLFRSALAATELRSEADNLAPVPTRALEAALMVLERSAGNTLADAVLCRLRALRIRENAFIQIDPPPPMGTRLADGELDRRLADRTQPRAPTSPAVHAFDQIEAMREGDEILGEEGVDADPVVFPGQRVARLSDYVAIVKQLKEGDPAEVLSSAGLDEPAYRQVASMWGQRLATDASLHAKFAAMMESREPAQL